MKCSECGHRNRVEDNFCMICASPLTPTPPSNKRVALPPQDILEGLTDRAMNRAASAPVAPALWGWWATALLIIAVGIALYLLYFVDTYKVEAINYSPSSSYDQTGNSSADL